MNKLFTYNFNYGRKFDTPFRHPRMLLLNTDTTAMQSLYVIPHQLPVWSDIPIEFHEGFAAISRGLDKRWNYVSIDGKMMFDNWILLSANNFKDGYALVMTTGKYGSEYGYNFLYLNDKGKYDFLCRDKDDSKPYLFKDCHGFDKNGLARVKMRDGNDTVYIDKKARLYDKERRLLSYGQRFIER